MRNSHEKNNTNVANASLLISLQTHDYQDNLMLEKHGHHVMQKHRYAAGSQNQNSRILTQR